MLNTGAFTAEAQSTQRKRRKTLKFLSLGKRRLILVDARRLDRDGMQGGFCSKYRDICKKTNAADRPNQVIARHAE